MRPSLRIRLRPYVCLACRHPATRRRQFASKSGQIPDIYDVVCVGGGPAGLGLLAALRASSTTSNLKIALIETQDLDRASSWSLEPHLFSNRVSSLTPSSVSFLQRIGAWEHIYASRTQKYQEMKVWDGETDSQISFDWSMGTASPPESLHTIATMTENANLVRALLSRITASGNEGISIFSKTTVSSIENGVDHPDGPNLSAWPVLSLTSAGSAESQDSSKIAARLLVGADGINSPVRSFANITTNGWDYNRHGVVATLKVSDTGSLPTSSAPGIKTAYQRFLPALGGPIALLPLPENYATLVWSTTVENAAYLKSLPPSAFLAMVNAAFRLSMADLKYMASMDCLSPTPGPEKYTHEDELSWRLQHTAQPSHVPPMVTAVQEGSVASFPLRFRHASEYISPRVALVGDAAHVIHPLAGQGLNLGLGDVASLFTAIEYAVTHGMDIGDLISLERYAAERYFVNAKISGACDVLHKLYNVPGQGPVAWARGLGLNLIDRLPFVKEFLMKSAEG